jgi:hypothetical protein
LWINIAFELKSKSLKPLFKGYPENTYFPIAASSFFGLTILDSLSEKQSFVGKERLTIKLKMVISWYFELSAFKKYLLNFDREYKRTSLSKFSKYF